jgi:hypothetical protein
MRPGTPVKVINEISRMRGDGTIPKNTLGIISWSDPERGYAEVQFIGRVKDHMVPLANLEVATFKA